MLNPDLWRFVLEKCPTTRQVLLSRTCKAVRAVALPFIDEYKRRVRAMDSLLLDVHTELRKKCWTIKPIVSPAIRVRYNGVYLNEGRMKDFSGQFEHTRFVVTTMNAHMTIELKVPHNHSRHHKTYKTIKIFEGKVRMDRVDQPLPADACAFVVKQILDAPLGGWEIGESRRW
jgi:hypothetical protein